MINVMNAAGFMQVLANFGFPIVITFYLLFRFEKRLESIEKTLKKNEEKRREQE
ncbi:YvrJ family protein [Salibacterium qingdaonense]|uniref:YvrJ protein family protein n=1 Tax=Salibacterium qingdaonense TaxID=266892 RepID=A0A1I4LCJ4_9BACI|nr:YvrJ family protein [Salibacterium qingdaonense]SFL88765.1 YvrJ protein family protein [Salibacterium qingdaonense]